MNSEIDPKERNTLKLVDVPSSVKPIGKHSS